MKACIMLDLCFPSQIDTTKGSLNLSVEYLFVNMENNVAYICLFTFRYTIGFHSDLLCQKPRREYCVCVLIYV